jgi:hypothetical protein
VVLKNRWLLRLSDRVPPEEVFVSRPAPDKSAFLNKFKEKIRKKFSSRASIKRRVYNEKPLDSAAVKLHWNTDRRCFKTKSSEFISFIFGLFSDAVSSLYCVTFGDKMINEQ